MIGTQDLEKRIVASEEVFLILMIRDVEPQHDGAEVDAPGRRMRWTKAWRRSLMVTAVEVSGSTYWA